jgi:uncharacterized membrane protein
MTDPAPAYARAERVPDPSLVSWTHWMYALHAFSAAMGIFTATTVIGQFIFGVPSIVAVIMNYVKRGDASGTWLESHFGWLLRTFWFAVLWFVLIGLFSAPLVLLLGLGVVTWILGAFVVGIWIVYRVARGWLALKDGRPVPG